MKSFKLIIAVFTMYYVAPAFTKGPDIKFYSGQKEKLSVKVDANKNGYLQLSGKTSYGLLYLHDTKGSQQQMSGVPLHDGEFKFKYYFPRGKGGYTLLFLGGSKSNLQIVTVAQLTVKSSSKTKSPSADLNKEILEYVKSQEGKKVGRGECWDLAQEALDLKGAIWTRPIGYGKKVPLKKAKPGDILQFKKVKIVRKTKNAIYTEMYGAPDHTAIVWKVKSQKPLILELAHQNYAGKRYVLYSDMNLGGTVTGKLEAFRARKIIEDLLD